MNPLWTLLPPLAVIPFILFFGERRRNWREGSIVVAGMLLLWMNGEIYESVLAGAAPASGSIDMIGGLSLALSAEPMGVMFALLASFLWVVTTFYSVGYMRGHHEVNQTRFYVCFAIAIASVMVAAYADNLLTLFVAYEVLTLSTFPLVTHAGNDKARMAGRTYLGILMGSSIGLLMPAMIWTWVATGSLTFTPGGLYAGTQINGWALGLMLTLFVFGIGKAAVMPLHRWLPAAMVAPTPVSALLHAVAVVKTGVFSLLKIATYIVGVDTLAGATSVFATGGWLLWVAGFTILAASLVAFSKDNLKARLAYSTVSQLSYIVAAALLGTSIAVTGGALHIVMHGFAKITLFFCAGAIMVATHKTDVSQLDGIGRRMPLTMVAFLIGTLGIIGLPPASGMWSKLLIAQGTLDTGQLWLIAILMISTLLNIAYLLPISIRAFFRPPPPAVVAGTTSQAISEAPLFCVWALSLTALGTLLLFFFPGPLLELLALIQWR